MSEKVAIFLAPGFEMGEAIVIIDLLTRASIPVDIVSITDESNVLSSHNVEIICTKLISEINFTDYKMLILPGGAKGVENLIKCEPLKKALVMFAQDETKWIAAICAAPQILGGLGLLNGKEVSFYPGCDVNLETANKTKKPTVTDGNIVTGKSLGSVFEFSLQLINVLKDEEVMQNVKGQLAF